MNNYAYLIKAKAKAQAKSLFCWFSAKSDSRAEREILNILEDNAIDVGRGADYQLPVRTDWYVVDDLPVEGALDDTWCDRYELGENGRSWQKINAPATIVDGQVFVGDAFINDGEISSSKIDSNYIDASDTQDDVTDDDSSTTEYPVARLRLPQRIISQLISDKYTYHVNQQRRIEIGTLEMDTDNSYVQNILVACRNVPEVENLKTPDLWKLTNAVKTIFTEDKRCELGRLIHFIKLWVETPVVDRGILVREWVAGKRITAVQRTDSGTNAGGGNKTDRNPDLNHDLDSLDIEIALATLQMDFNIYDIPGAPYRRAKEIIQEKEYPFIEWSAALRSTPGILDYSRAAIFALIRSAPDGTLQSPESLRTFISFNLSEIDHSSPSEETLKTARHIPEESWDNEISRNLAAERGEYVEGISDPNDPKWVKGNTANTEHALPEWAKTEEQSIAEETGTEPHTLPKWAENLSGDSEHNNPPAEATDNVSMEETRADEADGSFPLPSGQDETHPTESNAETGSIPDTLNNEAVHQNPGVLPGETVFATSTLFTHLMIDLETMGKPPLAPITSIGAVFFDPETGTTGADFYKVISLESAIAWGAVPEASTIIWWLKQSSEARAEIASDDAIPLDDALLQLNDFIAENFGVSGIQVWGKGPAFDNVVLRASYERTGIVCPWKYWNDRDVRTMIELGKAVGMNPCHDIPFEGDQHNALADAHHQVKYVSAIWQRLTAN